MWLIRCTIARPWAMNRKVWPHSRCGSASRSSTRSCTKTSRDALDSSRISGSGSTAPERCSPAGADHRTARAGITKRTRAEGRPCQAIRRPVRARLPSLREPVDEQGLGDRHPDVGARVERGGRILQSSPPRILPGVGYQFGCRPAFPRPAVMHAVSSDIGPPLSRNSCHSFRSQLRATRRQLPKAAL